MGGLQQTSIVYRLSEFVGEKILYCIVQLSSGADLVVVVGDGVVVEGAAAAVALVPPQAGVGGRVREARGLEAGLHQVRVRVE